MNNLEEKVEQPELIPNKRKPVITSNEPYIPNLREPYIPDLRKPYLPDERNKYLD